MAKSRTPTAPVRTEPTSWEHFKLWERVREALYALGLHFQSKTNIEGMPNFRFTASPLACNPWDLLVVIPWALSNVLSGTPVVYAPFIEMSRFAAEQRNYYWEYERESQGESGIVSASGIGPYPRKSERISDRAISDSGGNYGRLARYGVMSDYVRETMATMVCGVSAKDWLGFLKRHARDSSGETSEE